ncbi:MAG: CAP domain-containing protein [Halobacteriales archaeon]|nr:CAP domain-containing protein [Halobacteriales archaeon]
MGLVDEFVPGKTTAFLLLVLFAVVGYTAVAGPVTDDPLDTDEVERLVAEETNELRAENGVSSVETDVSLKSAARAHSSDMARHGYVGHESDDGELPFERYELCSAEGYAGENVASAWYGKNFVYDEAEVPTLHLSSEREVAEHLVRAWNDSEGHRRTLLNEDWESIGVGVAVTEDDKVLATQAFCSGPLADSS